MTRRKMCNLRSDDERALRCRGYDGEPPLPLAKRDILNRHCERSEAIHRAAQRKNGLLRRFAPRNDDGHEAAFPRRDSPG
jgi:hypothetical protein